MKVRCIDNIGRITGVELNCLKKGKVYHVLEEDEFNYKILNEDGKEDWTVKDRFEIVEFNWEDFKNEKIGVWCNTLEKAKDFLMKCEELGMLWLDGNKLSKTTEWFIGCEETTYVMGDGGLTLGTKSIQEKHRDIVEWEIKTKEESKQEQDIKKGDRVKSTRTVGIYVKKGMLGTVLEIGGHGDLLIKWDEGLPDKVWYCKRSDVELVKKDIVIGKEGIAINGGTITFDNNSKLTFDIPKTRFTLRDIVGHSNGNGLYENESFYIQIDDDLIQITNKINDNIIAINMNDKFKFKKEYNFNEAFEQYEEGKEIISLVSNERYKKIDGNDKLWCVFDNKWVDNDFEMELVEIRGKWIVKD